MGSQEVCASRSCLFLHIITSRNCRLQSNRFPSSRRITRLGGARPFFPFLFFLGNQTKSDHILASTQVPPKRRKPPRLQNPHAPPPQPPLLLVSGSGGDEMACPPICHLPSPIHPPLRLRGRPFGDVTEMGAVSLDMHTYARIPNYLAWVPIPNFLNPAGPASPTNYANAGARLRHACSNAA